MDYNKNNQEFRKTELCLKALSDIKTAANKKGIKFWLLGGLAHAFHIGRVYREHNDLDLIVKTPKDQEEFLKILKSLGFEKISERKPRLTENLTNFIYENKQGVQVDIGPYVKEFGIVEEDFEEDEKELNDIKCRVLSKRYLIDFKKYQLKTRDKEKDLIDLRMLEEIPNKK